MTPDLRIFVAVTRHEVDLLFHPTARERLGGLGEVTFAASGARAALPAGLADSFDVVITSWSTAPFEAGALLGARLRLAAHSAGSVRARIPRKLLEQGLRVTQAAEAMAPAVAELAVTLTLVLLRNVHVHDRGLWTGRDWASARQPDLGRALSEQQVGIVGMSRTGRHYASMVRGMGVRKIRAYDPYADPAACADFGVELVGLDELFARSQVVAVHAPTTEETRRMIGARQLALLPDGAVFVNTARSWVVDQDAMLAELVSGRLRAGLDVFDTEPLPPGSSFYGLPNVVITPHVAGGTVEARFHQGDVVVGEIERFVAGEPLAHEITLDTYDVLA
ncbi:hydroxyacid dehydrogenase [Jiangella asiatica]|uniref:Hydroxyacid dehydrogenase n=1 Tax=Jiangella asiatica TaxID=2530372 RepID=A0A4R5DDP9_9ACTN|nr:hydroxyacid dehydrogenase [Jiangella asiatica]TDE11187.1 hydroxyacid dehydrogenase [Jiangella asiatica]